MYRFVLCRFALSLVCLISLVSAGCDETSASPQGQAPPSKPVQAPAVQTPTLPAAPVVFDPPLLDLGRLRPNERADGQVILRNTSDQPLMILDSKASCSCTSVSLKNVVVPPRSEVAVPVRFNGKSTTGVKIEMIKFDISGFEMAQVKIRVQVESPVVIEPSHISALPKNDVPTLNGVLTVRTVDGTPFRILAVNGAAPAFVDFNPALDEPRPMYRITWDVSEFDPRTCVNSAGKKMPGWFLIETDREDAPILNVEVRSKCTMRQLPAPGQYWLMDQKSAMIGRLKAGESTEFTMGMKWKAGMPIDDTIREIRSESPNIDVELVEVREEGETIDVVVKVTAKGTHRGALYAPIRFYSSRHECPVVVLGQIVD